MGYYTTYEMYARNVDEETACKIRDFLQDRGVLNYAFSPDFYLAHGVAMFFNLGECKWYEHDEDMTALSCAFPDVTFKLCGNGEEQGDIWETLYKNGESETRYMVFPPFKQLKWEE